MLGGVVIEGVDSDPDLDPTPANRPSLTNTSMGGEGITLASSDTILGLNVVSTMDSAILGNNVDSVTLDHVAVVDSGGAAIEVANSTNLDLTFTGLDSLTSIEDGVLLDTVTGSLTVSGTTQLDNPAGAGIRMINSPGFVASFAAVNVVDAGGGMPHPALELTNDAGATFTFGALNLDSENGPGFLANNGGTVNHPSSGNVVNAVGGAAVDIQSTTGNAGGSPGWSFDSLTSTGSPDTGVRLVSLAQDFNVGAGGTTVTDADTTGILVQNSGMSVDYDFGDTSVTDSNVGMGATANGIDVTTGNSSATFTFDSLDVVTDGGFGLKANSSGTITVGGSSGNSIVATGGAAIDATSTGIGGSGWIFDTLSSSGSSGTGVNLVSMTGVVTGKAGSITGAAGTAFNVDMGAPTVTYSGSVTQNAAQRVVNIEDTTGGSVTFDTGTVTGGASSLGVRIDNADGNASFADLDLGTSGARMTNQALTLSGGSTGTFSFAGTQIFTSGATRHQRHNGGTVQVTGCRQPGGRAERAALDLRERHHHRRLGVTFERIDASGSDRGIRLLGAGSGFTVTGVGTTDGTGGTISNMTTRGIELISTDGVSLTDMMLTNANTIDGATSDGTSSADGNADENSDENGAIHLDTVVGVHLTNVDIDGTEQHGINGRNVTDLDLDGCTIQNTGNEIWESGIYLFQLRGTGAAGTDNLWQNSTINHSGEFNVFVRNNDATNAAPGAMDRLAMSNMTFMNSGDNVAGQHVLISNRDTANFQTLVSGSSFSATINKTSDSIQVDSGNSSHSDASITSSNFLNGNLAINLSGSGTSTTTFNVSNNDSPGISSRGSSGVNIASNSSASMTGTVANNMITSNITNSAGIGVDAVVNSTGSIVVDIDGNTITQKQFGIRAGARNAGSGSVDVTVRNNTVTTSAAPNGFEAIYIFAGNGSSSESNRTCVHYANNTATSGSSGLGIDDYVLEQYTGNTFQIEGLTGSGANQTNVESFVAATDSTGTPNVDAFYGAIVDYTAATCATP